MSNKEIALQESEMNANFFQEEIQKSALEERQEIDHQTSIELFKGLSKHKIKELSTIAVDNVISAGNPLEIAEALSSMQLFIEEIKGSKKFTDCIREELEKSKTFTSQSGAKIELAETGTKYDFSQCNDTVLFELNQKLESVKADVKTRETFLKTLPLSGLEIIDKESGEVITIFPPSKSSTSSYKITLSK